MSESAIIHITTENFEKEVLHSDAPVMIDFFADWCGPCKMLSPMIDEIAEENRNIKVCKLDVDNCNKIASDFQVMSVPTVLFLKNGDIVAQEIGAKPKSRYMEIIQSL